MAQQEAESVVTEAVVQADTRVSKIAFDTNEHSFGEIPEDGGVVQYTFTFKNLGEVPVSILEAKPSCNCTAPSWTQEPVAPGGTGQVVAEFDPYNLPGKFHKTITVNTNAEPNTVILNISGTVLPKKRTVADDFPKVMGDLRLSAKYLDFGRISTEKPVTKTFAIYNQGNKTLKFDAKDFQLPAYISVALEPEHLQKEERGKLIVTYDAAQRNDLGWLVDNITLKTNENGANAAKSIQIMATVEEFFPPMTQEELAQAPRLGISKKNHEFGTVSEGRVVEFDVTLTNNGKQELQIRKTKGNCGCTVGTPEKMALAPGESTQMKVSFNTQGRQGNQYKEVSIFTNDPKAPVQKVVLKGEVK